MIVTGQKQHIVDVLFMIALFCVFASSALFVVLIGANVYRQTTEQMDQTDISRTSLLYLSEKIRQSDRVGSISIGTVGGQDALILEQELEGNDYLTYIYSYDGFLRELFVSKEHQVSPEEGQEILQLKEMQIRQKDGMYWFTATDENDHTHFICLRSKCG